MSLFHLTSAVFDGFVEFEFDKNGILVHYDTRNATMSTEHMNYLLNRFPRHIDQAKQLIADSETAMLVEITADVSFDMFWNKYNEKTNSSKKRALQKWNRMSKSERALSYQYINKYFLSIPYGTRKKYAETYLNAELWNN
jgi:hypothetical protein